MPPLTDFKVLCFDVYGTLIDWEAGVMAALRPALATHEQTRNRQAKHILAMYHEMEARQQIVTPEALYSDVVASVYAELLEALHLPPPGPEARRSFGRSVGTWPAFDDTVAALRILRRYYRFVVLSNTDHESFDASRAGPLAGFDGAFDLVLTAEDIGSYKPSLRNFEAMIHEVATQLDVPRTQILHTAQSQFHDHHPAHKVGLHSAWIVRPGATMGCQSQEHYDFKFDTLMDMAKAVEAAFAAKE